MAEPGGERWQDTSGLAATTLGVAGGIVLAAIAVMILTGPAAGLAIIYLAGTIAFPFALAGLVFWLARRQEAIDRQYGHFED